MEKFLLINKPAGITSHDVVDRLRQITGIKRIGHAGTLDPLATGLLILGIGRESTKQLDRFLKLNKEYEAVLQLGAVSDTYDKTGEIQIVGNKKQLAVKDIKLALKKFKGEQRQIPPIYSAKKIKGRKAYELARKGEKVELQAWRIIIYKIKLKKWWKQKNQVKILVKCSSGTYIRSLGYDIGQELGVGAYLEELTRTKIGKFRLKKAVDLESLDNKNWKRYLAKN